MLRSYLLVAIRNLLRTKGYTLINVLGLAIGMAACLLIALYIRGELGYEAWMPNSDRIYLVLRESHPPGQPSYFERVTSGALGETLVAEFPEVEASIRLRSETDMPIVVGERGFDRWVTHTESHYLEFFGIPLVEGDPATALRGPSAVISRERAEELFPGEDPIGKVLTVTSHRVGGDFTVGGVYDGLPGKTTLRPGILIANTTSEGLELNQWFGWQPHAWRAQETYIRLAAGADPKALEAKLPDLMERHMGEEVRATNTWHLLPIRDIYLHSIPRYNLRYSFFYTVGDVRDVYTFSAVAVLILAIACINYVNLTTARAVNRAREVGLRKAVGAQRSQLVAQFLGEASVVAFLALAIAVLMVMLCLPTFNALSGQSISLTGDLGVVTALALVVLCAGLVSGSYPAFVLSRLDAVRVLRGSAELGGHRLRTTLVVVQFAVTVVLIVLTIVIQRQMAFINDRDPGFDKEGLITMPIFRINTRLEGRNWNPMLQNYETVKTAFLAHPSVLKASAHRRTPGIQGGGLLRVVRPETDPHTDYKMEIQNVDGDFLDTYGIEIVAGSGFKTFEESQNRLILNEAAVEQFGWTPEEAIGKRIVRPNNDGDFLVMGVMRDFNTESVRSEVRPMSVWWVVWIYNILTVRVNMENLPETLAFLEATWNQVLPERPFTYRFVDENLAEMYIEERNQERTLTTFSALAILVSCLGLLGLASFNAEQRFREIGVRKVLGASSGSVVVLMTRRFLAPVGIAIGLALPFAWYAADDWLNGFAYRMDLSIDLFVVGVAVALCVGFLAVISQSMRAAVTDPVEVLRRE